MKLKLCTACLAEKPEDDFSRNQLQKRFHERRCTGCAANNAASHPLLKTACEEHAAVPEDAKYFVETVVDTIDTVTWRTEGHGLLGLCVEMKIHPESDGRNIGIIAGFFNEEDGSATVNSDTLFKVVFVDMKSIAHEANYTVGELLGPEREIEVKDIFADGLVTATATDWMRNVRAAPYPAMEQYLEGEYARQDELDDSGFFNGPNMGPSDVYRHEEGGSPAPKNVHDNMLAKALTAKMRKGIQQMGAVEVGNGSMVTVNKWGGGVFGNEQHGVSHDDNGVANYALVLDVHELPMSEWSESAKKTLEEAKNQKPRSLPDGQVARGYSVKHGEIDYIKGLVDSQKVRLGWARAFEDVVEMSEIMEKLQYPDEEDKSKGLFVNHFSRGAAVSGRNGGRTMAILEKYEPFRKFFGQIRETYSIRHCWMVANLSGEHGFHQDSFQRNGTHRIIVTILSDGKLMWFMEP